MDTSKGALKVILALFFVVTGTTHFFNTSFFLQIMPEYVPQGFHLTAVYVAGALEILLGLLLLVPQTTRLAAWCLIGLLLVVTPMYVHVYRHPEILPDISPRLHFWRLPIQVLLILWAFWYTQPDDSELPATQKTAT